MQGSSEALRVFVRKFGMENAAGIEAVFLLLWKLQNRVPIKIFVTECLLFRLACYER